MEGDGEMEGGRVGWREREKVGGRVGVGGSDGMKGGMGWREKVIYRRV